MPRKFTSSMLQVHIGKSIAKLQRSATMWGSSNSDPRIGSFPNTHDSPHDVEFVIRVKNFGNTDLKDVQVQLFRNGQGNELSTLQIATLPANQERVETFQVRFKQGATENDPLARFNLVTALLTNIGSDGLAADNIRHAIVEVREKLTVLFVVNPDDKPDDPKSDSFYLRRLFETKFEAIDVKDSGGIDLLEKHDLRQYSSIYLLNIPELKKAQVDNLERYVQAGGGVGLFLGQKVRAEPYNDLLYRGGAGFFPVPLPPTFTDELSPEAKTARSLTFAKRILIRDDAVKSHPAVAGVYTNDKGKPSKEVEKSTFSSRSSSSTGRSPDSGNGGRIARFRRFTVFPTNGR